MPTLARHSETACSASKALRFIVDILGQRIFTVINMPIKSIAITALLILISGCASAHKPINHEPAGRFTSIMTPEQLSGCIDRNTDTWAFSGSFTNVKNISENHYEIDISNSKGPFVNINVTPYKSENSLAIFRFPFSGFTAKNMVTQLTKRCA